MKASDIGHAASSILTVMAVGILIAMMLVYRAFEELTNYAVLHLFYDGDKERRDKARWRRS
jgi:hypothetical protein